MATQGGDISGGEECYGTSGVKLPVVNVLKECVSTAGFTEADNAAATPSLKKITVVEVRCMRQDFASIPRGKEVPQRIAKQ